MQTGTTFTDEVLFRMKDRDPAKVDYYRANAVTGEVKPVTDAAAYLLKIFEGDFNERVAVALDTKDLG
jgi:hypothetical protein